MTSADIQTHDRAAVPVEEAEFVSPPEARPKKKRIKKRRISTFWMKQIHTIHWMSSAVCLVGLLLFAVTGFTLNHAADIAGNVTTDTVETQLPAPLLAEMQGSDELSPAIAEWTEDELDIDLSGRVLEWSEQELYVPLARPGGDGWIAIDRTSGDVIYENTDRGMISFLNDLHKGRDTGPVWYWFIDVLAVGCVLFALSGLLLLYIHSRFRASTWPIVGAGLVVPLFIVLLFVHY